MIIYVSYVSWYHEGNSPPDYIGYDIEKAKKSLEKVGGDQETIEAWENDHHIFSLSRIVESGRFTQNPIMTEWKREDG